MPADRYWGAQTQRALEHFAIGDSALAAPFLRALGLIKLVSARVNGELGLLPARQGRLDRERRARRWSSGALDEHFPLVMWQSGSGTQTNMNAQRGDREPRERARAAASSEPSSRVHPNDDVNRCQSSNDVIPSAIHVAAAERGRSARLLPALAGAARRARGEGARLVATS